MTKTELFLLACKRVVEFRDAQFPGCDAFAGLDFRHYGEDVEYPELRGKVYEYVTLSMRCNGSDAFAMIEIERDDVDTALANLKTRLLGARELAAMAKKEAA